MKRNELGIRTLHGHRAPPPLTRAHCGTQTGMAVIDLWVLKLAGLGVFLTPDGAAALPVSGWEIKAPDGAVVPHPEQEGK